MTTVYERKMYPTRSLYAPFFWGEEKRRGGRGFS